MFAPGWPGVVLAKHWRDFTRGHFRCRYRVVEPGSSHHDSMSRKGAAPQDARFLRFNEQFDAHVPPELGDQLERLDSVTTVASHLDDDLHYVTTRQQANTRVISFRQSDAVGQSIGKSGIISGVFGPIAVIVKRAFRQDGVVALKTQ